MVSRSIAKEYLSTLRQNTSQQLADISFYYNKFNESTLKTDVLPWLFDETEAFLEELNAHDELPQEMLATFVESTS